MIRPRAQVQRIRQAVDYVKFFTRPMTFLVFLLITGSTSYMFIEHYDVIDAFYMTVITLSTVGFGEVQPLTSTGKIFTSFLILGGVVFYGLAINGFIKTILERSFGKFMAEQKAKDLIKQLKDHYIICGGGRMSLAICLELERAGKPFVVLERDADSPVFQHAHLKSHDWLVLERNALLEEALVDAGIERARGLFAVLPTDSDNLFVVLSARGLSPSILIETRIAEESSRKKMLQAGANKVLSPYNVGGMQMARSMLRPEVDEFLEVFLDGANFEFEMQVYHVSPEDKIANKELRDCGFADEGFMAVGIKYPNQKIDFAPKAETVIEPGCEVFLVGKGRRARS